MNKLEQLELMRQKFLAGVYQLLDNVPKDEIKIEIDIYPRDSDTVKQLVDEAQQLKWICGAMIDSKWYSSKDAVEEKIDDGEVTIYLP